MSRTRDRASVQVVGYNYLDNGDFSIAQRNTVTKHGDFVADRMRTFGSSAGKVNTDFVVVAPDGARFTTYGLVDFNLLTTDFHGYRQGIEAGVTLLAGKTVTVSGYIQADKVHNYRLDFYHRPSDTGMTADIVLDGNGLSWTRFVCTVTLSEFLNIEPLFQDDHLLVSLRVDPGQAADKGYVRLTGWKLEEGDVATPFVPDHPAINFKRCQRFYQIVDVSDRVDKSGWTRPESISRVIVLPTPMRAIPTISDSVSGGSKVSANNGASTTHTQWRYAPAFLAGWESYISFRRSLDAEIY